MDRLDDRTEVRQFLTTRRAEITPALAGVPLYGQRRRVPALRREEVAQLAGRSTDYYTRSAGDFYPDWEEAAEELSPEERSPTVVG